MSKFSQGWGHVKSSIKSGEVFVNPFALEPTQFLTGKSFTKQLGKLDPTKVARADTKAQESLIEQAQKRSDEFFNKKAERFQPKQINWNDVQSGTMTPAQIEQAASRNDFMNALTSAQQRVNQAGRIDPAMQDYLQRSLMQGATTKDALAMLQAAAQGNAPSQAQAVMQAGTDEAIRAQMAMGASGGFNPANLRGAQAQGSLMQQQAINQAAQLRAQEMAQARQTYGQLGMSADQAQQQMLANAAQQTFAASQFQDQAKQNALNAYLQSTQNLYGMDQERAMQQAQFAQQAGMFNIQNQLAANQFNARQAMEAQQLNNQFGQNALNSYLAAQQAQQGLGAQMLGSAMSGQQAITQMDQARLSQSSQARKGLLGTGLQAVGTLAAAIFSDKNQKKNIKPNKETQEFLNALTDNQYEYKDTSLPGTQSGTNYGPMAQDLEKTKMGKTAVFETANGKMVDSGRGFLLALSGLANLNQRLTALESK